MTASAAPADGYQGEDLVGRDGLRGQQPVKAGSVDLLFTRFTSRMAEQTGRQAGTQVAYLVLACTAVP